MTQVMAWCNQAAINESMLEKGSPACRVLRAKWNEVKLLYAGMKYAWITNTFFNRAGKKSCCLYIVAINVSYVAAIELYHQ